MNPLSLLPCPRWLSRGLDAHHRRRVLCLHIWLLSDRTTATAALWVARVYAPRGGTVECALRLLRDRLVRGEQRRSDAS